MKRQVECEEQRCPSLRHPWARRTLALAAMGLVSSATLAQSSFQDLPPQSTLRLHHLQPRLDPTLLVAPLAGTGAYETPAIEPWGLGLAAESHRFGFEGITASAVIRKALVVSEGWGADVGWGIRSWSGHPLQDEAAPMVSPTLPPSTALALGPGDWARIFQAHTSWTSKDGSWRAIGGAEGVRTGDSALLSSQIGVEKILADKPDMGIRVEAHARWSGLSLVRTYAMDSGEKLDVSLRARSRGLSLGVLFKF